MELKQLVINNFRNLSSIDLTPNSGFNLFYGENGAGKTSVLEAIHVLSHGRSFRSGSARELIQYQKDSFIVRAQIFNGSITNTLGLERTPSSTKARLNAENVSSISALSDQIPVQVVHPASFDLLTGEPASRRAFLDWGLYFSDKKFRTNWLVYKRALSQRNAAIKKHLADELVVNWNRSLIEAGGYISSARKHYLSRLKEYLPHLAETLGEELEIELFYKIGWNQSLSLEDEFNNNLERDRRLGYTYGGPHRADFQTNYAEKEAGKYASRGQIKHITLLLKLAQSKVFIADTGNTCVLLLDDLSSELDANRMRKVISVISKLDLQTFVTSVEPLTKYFKKGDFQMFHVKHGEILVVPGTD